MDSRRELADRLVASLPQSATASPATVITWVVHTLDRTGYLRGITPDAPLAEPVPLGTVVLARHQRIDAPAEHFTKFTMSTSAHSTSRWISERGVPTTWAMLINPEIIKEQG